MEKVIKDGKELIEWEPIPLQSDRFSVDPVTGNVGIGTPSQEPVAWANSYDLQNFDMKVRTCPDLHHTVPLYTAPPKREWVGLNFFDQIFLRTTYAPVKMLHYITETDTDIVAEVVNDWEAFFTAIEAKLEEKNHGR